MKMSTPPSTRLKTFKYRLYPSKRQKRNLFRVLACARSFYNMCVSERKWAYELEGRSVSRTEQLRQVKHYKATFPQARGVHSHILQVAVSDCDKAFQAFFRRVKAGETPGYPRFKGRDRFHSFGLKEYGNGWKVDGRKLHITGIGRVPVRWHRHMEGTPKTLRVIHKAGKWYIAVVCEVSHSMPLSETGRVVGIDVGISALITTSAATSRINSALISCSSMTVSRWKICALATWRETSTSAKAFSTAVGRCFGSTSRTRLQVPDVWLPS